MDEGEGRKKFLEQVRKGCRIAKTCASWACGPTASSGSIRRAARGLGAGPRGQPGEDRRDVQAGGGDRRGARRAAGRRGRDLLGRHALLAEDGRPAGTRRHARDASASRPTWPTRCSTRSATTPPRTASCPRTSTGRTGPTLDEALRTLTAALRPWTIDFHVAQNDATVHGSGSHDKTGRHCLANDPNGKLDIPHHAGFWLRDEKGQLTKTFRHICWDGCMFPNAVMMKPQTWNDILAAMIAVRDAHGWRE